MTESMIEQSSQQTAGPKVTNGNRRPWQEVVADKVAIRDALKAARKEFGETGVLHLQSPATPERIRISCADPILKRAWVEPKEGEKSFFVAI